MSHDALSGIKCHIGNINNIVADFSGTGDLNIFSMEASLNTLYDVIDKAFVIHKSNDRSIPEEDNGNLTLLHPEDNGVP